MKQESKYSMFYGATPEIFENAKILRDNPTQAEKKLWQHLCNRQLGVKFRRQHPINCYIVDFYCHKSKLVVEVDGEYHNTFEQSNQDLQRTHDIQQFNIKVVRFSNEQVLSDIESVVKIIKNEIISQFNGS